MRVLLINAVYKLSSTGRNCSELSEYMNKRGVKCITAFSVGTEDKYSFRVSPVIECKYHAIMSRATGMQGYHSPISTKRIIKLIMDFKPDIVHLNNLHANYINLNDLLSFLALNKTCTVVTLHDCWLYTGKCTHYTSIGCDKWKTGCEECPKLKDDHNSWFFDRTKRMWKDKVRSFNSISTLGVIGVSKWISNEAKKSPVFQNAKIIDSIYNWIDLDVFQILNNAEKTKSKYGLQDKKVILGVSGRWGNEKGLDKFIELSRIIPADTKIVLLGKMPNIKLPDNIINISATDKQEELVDIYNMADVFLQLSKEESFGKVVAEALACGVPVITNSNTANPELVDNTCGIIAGDSIEEINSSVLEVLSKEKKYYSSACRKFATYNFSKDINICKHLEFYKMLLAVNE